ncbi:unnamed protein product [Paramecium sonneborni]|uniref:Uncharacterized protein n=1 Tax=Paramecium sonneborni TaxID=65129 RepID=A0A8S1RH22_9CILI|nr:unnamed protein product [Paramecium sonneborni]
MSKEIQHLQNLHKNYPDVREYFQDNIVQQSIIGFKNTFKYRIMMKKYNLTFPQHQKILSQLIKALTKRQASLYFTYFIDYVERFSDNYQDDAKKKILEMLNYIIENYSDKMSKFTTEQTEILQNEYLKSIDLENFINQFVDMQWLIDDVWKYIQECIANIKELKISIIQETKEFQQNVDQYNINYKLIISMFEALKSEHQNKKRKKKNNIFVIKEICNWIERKKEYVQDNYILILILNLLKIKHVNFINSKVKNERINKIENNMGSESIHNINFNKDTQNCQEQYLSQKNFDFQDQPENQIDEEIDSYNDEFVQNSPSSRNSRSQRKIQKTQSSLEEEFQSLFLTKCQQEQLLEEEQSNRDQQESQGLYESNDHEINQIYHEGQFLDDQLQ